METNKKRFEWWGEVVSSKEKQENKAEVGLIANAFENNPEVGGIADRLVNFDGSRVEVAEEVNNLPKATIELTPKGMKIIDNLSNRILTNPTVLEEWITVLGKTDKEKYSKWVEQKIGYNELYNALKSEYPNLIFPTWKDIETKVNEQDDGNIALGYARALEWVNQLLIKLKNYNYDTSKVVANLRTGYELNTAGKRWLDVNYGFNKKTLNQSIEKENDYDRGELENKEVLSIDPIKRIIMFNPYYIGEKWNLIERVLNSFDVAFSDKEMKFLKDNRKSMPYVYVDTRIKAMRPMSAQNFGYYMDKGSIFVNDPNKLDSIVDTIKRYDQNRANKEESAKIKKELLAKVEESKQDFEIFKNSFLVFVELDGKTEEISEKISNDDMEWLKVWSHYMPVPILVTKNGTKKLPRTAMSFKQYKEAIEGWKKPSIKTMWFEIDPNNIILNVPQSQLANIIKNKKPEDVYRDLLAIKAQEEIKNELHNVQVAIK